MTTTIRYPSQTKQTAQILASHQEINKNKFDLNIVSPSGGYPIFTQQVTSISALGVLMSKEFLVEFNIDPQGRVIKTVQDIAMVGDSLIILIRSLDGAMNEQFSVSLLDAMVIGATMGSLKDRETDKSTNLLTSCFDSNTSDSAKLVVAFQYGEMDWNFPNIK